MRSLVLVRILAAALSGAAATVGMAQDGVRVAQVQFAAGTAGTSVTGSISGRDSIAYMLGLAAGQTLVAQLTSTHTGVYFNVYAPGSGPGDAALAVSAMTGPMVPDLNRFEGKLESSGTYTILVYLYRNAARRGETANFVLDIAAEPLGDLAAPVQGDFADGLAGGPDFFEVRTASGSPLNLRRGPSAGGAVLARLEPGRVVRNLGCRMNEARRWCRVSTLGDPGKEGWVAGKFLIESDHVEGGTALVGDVPAHDGTDALVPGTEFHATGQIDCRRSADAAAARCDFGVRRAGGGSATVTVFWPDTGLRVIVFDAGTPVSFTRAEAEADLQLSVTRQDDTQIVVIGPESFEIPDAVIFGG